MYKRILLSKCEWSDLRKNYLRLISTYQEEFKKFKILEFELFYLYRENKDEIVLKQANNTKLFFYFSQKSKFKNLLYLGTNFQELNKNQNYRYLSSHLGDYIENYSENKDSFFG